MVLAMWPSNPSSCSTDPIVIPPCPPCPEYPPCPPAVPDYCASWPLPAGGFAYRVTDVIDPLATVIVSDCSGVAVLHLYQQAGGLHNTAMRSSDGAVVGYAMDASFCSVASWPIGLAAFCPPAVPCPPVTAPVYSASWPLPAGGYLYRLTDSIDPIATVVINDCANLPVLRGYPASGVGHTLALVDSSGMIIAYAADASANAVQSWPIIAPVVNIAAVPCPPVTAPVYSASWPLPAGGYLYRLTDSIDPIATVVINDCQS
jgi:hypothetical protein